MGNEMATLPIYLEVEDVAVGPVLIALKKMPGIIKMNLDLGEGPKLPSSSAYTKGANYEQMALQLFARHNGGPLSLQQLQSELGGAKPRTYGVLHALKKKGVVQQVDKGQYQVNPKAIEHQPAPRALPKPTKNNGHDISKTPTGRAKPGAGWQAISSLLTERGAMKAIDLRTALEPVGVSPKSLSGILDRSKRDGLLKKTSSGAYELTAKGKNNNKEEAAVEH
jgi:Mn-dependent DtxR family transcriptional regulator